MPKTKTGEVKFADLKEKYLAYYSKLPIKRYAAAHIGKDEDTTLIWEKEDSEFSERIVRAKADYLMSKAKNLRSEFIIPLLFRELTPRTEHTGADGEPFKIEIVDSKPEDDKE